MPDKSLIERSPVRIFDRAIGDGDHGVNMQRGFEAVLAEIDTIAGQDPDAALKALGEDPLVLQAKEGLALINGTNFSTSCLALTQHDAAVLARTADVACALGLEALGGHARAALSEYLTEVRPKWAKPSSRSCFVTARGKAMTHSFAFGRHTIRDKNETSVFP